MWIQTKKQLEHSLTCYKYLIRYDINENSILEIKDNAQKDVIVA